MNSKMKIYLVRHGEVSNPRKILYGRMPDFHLSREGQRQIRLIARKLKKVEFNKIYTSPLERALETASIITKELGLNQKKIIIEPSLIESDVTKWEGKPIVNFKKSTRLEDLFGRTGIEPILKSGKRILSVLKKISKQKGNYIVVSHGDPIMGALIIISKNEKITNNYIKKGSFIRVDINDNKWKLAPFNEV